MATEPNTSTAPGPAEATPTFNLQIVSPTVGVPQPFSLSDLPVSTTVKQLKERIRDSLPSKPADHTQRLIYHGRLLARDNETMQELFGEETLRSMDRQTLHLVLRDTAEAQSTVPVVPPTQTPIQPQPQIPNPNPANGPSIFPQPHHHHHLPQGHFAPPNQARVGVPWQNNAVFGLPQPQIPGVGIPGQHFAPIPGMTPAQIMAQQQNLMTAAMNTMQNLNRAQMDHRAFQEAINRGQRGRAADGLRGAQDNPGANNQAASGTNTPGRTASPFQPDGTRYVVQEGIGPNGQQWRITVGANQMQRPSRSASPFSPGDSLRGQNGTPQPRSVPHGGTMSGADLQHILTTSDENPRFALRRNASSSSMANLPHSHSVHATQSGPALSRSGSRRATPEPGVAATLPPRSTGPTSHPQQNQQAPSAPEVYILSSPSGPRAILMNGGAETYVTPQTRGSMQGWSGGFPQRPLAPAYGAHFPLQMQQVQLQQPHRSPVGGMWTAPPQPSPHNHQHQAQHQPNQGVGQVQIPQQNAQLGPPQNAIVRPANNNAQVRAVMLAQAWPHIWMIIRLGLFIWWFTTPNSSWSRWFTVVAIAVAMFVINAGFLNGFAEQIWVPIRRHLENLIPLADGHGNLQRPGGGMDNGIEGAVANGGPEQGVRREPNPADTAARLLRERQNRNANWFVNQARRLERAGILFLASIAPGVAERHIAHLEAEARAERQRREEEAAAAAARHAAESEGPGPTDAVDGPVTDETTAAGSPESQAPPQQQPDAHGNGAANAPAEEPLIAI